MPPTLNEVIKVIKELKPSKAPGSDGLAAEIYQDGGDTLTLCMYQLFIKLWEAAELPQDLKDASIGTINKNMGDKRLQKLPWYFTSISCWKMSCKDHPQMLNAQHH